MYEVEMVGTSLPQKIAESDDILNELRDKVLVQIGNIVRKKIQDRINSFNYKHGDGSRMMRACLISVDKAAIEVVIYNDDRIAPHTKWQERGVKPVSMKWLAGKTIPFVVNGGNFQFAGRGSRNYGAPNKKFVKVTEKALSQGKWFNPGYPGKFFYRDGLKAAIVEISKELKMFTFRISSGEVFR